MQRDEGNSTSSAGGYSEEELVDDARLVDITASEARRRRFARKSELITDAKRSSYQDRLHRERVYGILQLVRLPLIVLAVALYWVWGWWILALIVAVISIPLPGIAVVIANGKGEPRDKRAQNVYKPAAYREAVSHAQLDSDPQTTALTHDNFRGGPAALEAGEHEIVDVDETTPPEGS